jgi:hypothetical protein
MTRVALVDDDLASRGQLVNYCGRGATNALHTNQRNLPWQIPTLRKGTVC